MYRKGICRFDQSNKTSIINIMSFEDLMQEHIKALRENTKAIIDYTKAINAKQKSIDTEHSKESACRFCGITYKTMQSYIQNGMITPVIRKGGKREWFKESELQALCEAQRLYTGDYGDRLKILGLYGRV